MAPKAHHQQWIENSIRSTSAAFLPLPYELQSAVLTHLSVSDFFALRLTSRSTYQTLASHEDELSRSLWPQSAFLAERCECDCAPGSYEALPQARLTFDDLFQHMRRAAVEARLAGTLTDLIYSKFLRIEIRPGVARLDEMRAHLLDRVQLGLGHLQHYLIAYRRLLVAEVCAKRRGGEGDGSSNGVSHESGARPSKPRNRLALQLSVLQHFSPACRLHTAHVVQMLNTLVSMKLRPPSYATILERVARRWTKDPAAMDAVTKLYLFGGLEGVDFILKLRPYAVRIEAMRRFTRALDREAMDAAAAGKAGSTGATGGPPLREDWWLRAVQRARDGRGLALATMPLLDLETRRALFRELPQPEDVFLHPIADALRECGGWDANAWSVVGALSYLVHDRYDRPVFGH